MAATHQANQKQTVVVVPNLYYSNQLAEESRQIVDDVHLFPVDEVLSAEMAFASPEAGAERVSTLQALSQGQRDYTSYPSQRYESFYRQQKHGKPTNSTGRLAVKST